MSVAPSKIRNWWNGCTEASNALKSESTERRFAVTFHVLRLIEPKIDKSDYDHTLCRAVMWIAVAGLFRTGELVIDRHKPFEYRLLTFDSLKFLSRDPPAISITLEQSKTDIFRRSVQVKITNTTAIAALRQYIERRSRIHQPINSDPLFAKENGEPLDRTSFLKAATRFITAAGIDLSANRGISFRAGGATSLKNAGVDDRLIQVMGRWAGHSYKRYIDTPIQAFVDASAKL